ncbi:PAS domain-containing protein [Methylobacterium sp. GC_Met_2]|uniref:PAS domain-containing protein n=1 Tax=Methylobacterium sp. GC_Met_2 TaxID=2937376 RepID=UPI00226B3724
MSSSREQARIEVELVRKDGSHDPFTAAVRATRMPMIITDPHQADNPIVFVNDAFLNLTHYSREEILGRNCRFLQGPATNQSDIGKVREAIKQRKQIEIELLNYTKNGTTFWNRVLVSPVFDEQGALTYFFASQFDVTFARERMRTLNENLTASERTLFGANVELRANEIRLNFQLALNARLRDLTDPVSMMAEATAALGGHLGVAQVGFGEIDDAQTHVTVARDWNAGPIPSVVGTWCMDDFGPAFIAKLKTGQTMAIADVRENDLTANPFVAAAYDQIGTRAILDVPLVREGRMMAMLFIHHDQPRQWHPAEVALVEETCSRLWAAVERSRGETRLRKSHASLVQSQRRLDALIRSSSEVRFRLNEDWSSLQQLTGNNFIPDTTTDTSGWLDSYIPAEDRAAVRTEIARAIATKSTYAIEHRVNQADGTIGWASSRAVPLFDDQGEITEWYGAATDITDSRRAEAALRESEARLRELNETLEQRVAEELASRSQVEDQLRQSQKLEAVGQLTGGVAHDFNNLLTVIRSSTDLLKRSDLSEERRTRYIGAISDTVDRAAKLTGQLLAFARRQALKPVVFAASDSVRALSDMIGTITGSRIRVTPTLPEEPCFVLADPSQFDTALVNMAVNARDAMNGEGQLTIQVKPVDGIPAVRAHTSRAGAFVAASVTDTGTGIPEDRLDQIFEPFFTTKETGKGTGLGLSQVIGFAKQSGGDVTVESEVGQGTTFTLYLPRVEAADVPGEPDDTGPLVDGHGMCVLVVEDNADVGTFAVQSLTDLGYVTVLASNAEEALAELRRDATRFDVVFSDVVMPGMSGIDLGQAIRAQHHDLPVVLTSGYSHVLAQNGTYGFELLHKPYSVEQLSRILSKAATWKRRKSIIGR